MIELPRILTEKLWKRKNKFPIITLDATGKPSGNDGNVESSTEYQNKIFLINFNEISSFTDFNKASMCVEVMTSDGQLGSLSHLQLDSDPETFADELTAALGAPSAVCLSGGEDGVSEKFISSLVTALTKRGFQVSLDSSNADIGGENIFRRATIYRDKVVVEKQYYSGLTEKVELQFPK